MGELYEHKKAAYDLQWDLKYKSLKVRFSEEHRDACREDTKRNVVRMLGLKYWGIDACNARTLPKSEIHHYVDRKTPHRGLAAPGGRNLLGRYDAVCAKVHADLDMNWKPVETKRSFWILHCAAVNIGETRRAKDLPDFTSGGELQEEQYLVAMQRILENIMAVCSHLGVEHLILFPFGMGALLRHLDLVDTRYEDVSVLQRLRRQIGRRFVQALEGARADFQVHFCVSSCAEEAVRNQDAFIRAFMGASPDLKKRVTFYPEADVMQMATDLAADSKDVLVVNGANRQLLGNHWFGNGARQAIDENLHRRSSSMAAVSYILNGYRSDTKFVKYGFKDLERNVERAGGTVHELHWR